MALKDPLFIVDVGHNPDAARALATFLKKLKGNRPIALVCGMLADKDAVGFFRLLKPVVDGCVLVPIDSERSMPMEQLMAPPRRRACLPWKTRWPKGSATRGRGPRKITASSWPRVHSIWWRRCFMNWACLCEVKP